jgi:5-(carboxyamino)imidazole ribonucleotide synthase
MAAARLGFRCHILAPEPESPAADVAAAWTRADYGDRKALDEFAAAVDVVTLEFENVPVDTLELLAERRPVRPSARVLRVTQDRLAEKACAAELGCPVTAYAKVENAVDLARSLAEIGPGVLKTTRFGYDGKGQIRVPTGDDLGTMVARLGQSVLIHEAWVDFALELSVITARSPSGAVRSYVPVENRHRHHILDVTLAPAAIPDETAAEAVAMAERIAAALGLEGLLAVEMFLTRDGQLLVNELAPRPHNSGHWTVDACAISQFELLVRVLCGLPLPDPGRFADAVMDNLLGSAIVAWPEWLAEPGARLHLYGKREIRAGRKLGHVTRLTRML